MSDSTENHDEEPMDETVAMNGTENQDEESMDETENRGDESIDETEEESPTSGKRNVLAYLEWAGLGLCVVLILVAGLRVYWGVGAFISLWVASKYEPIVSAGFNLAVLLLAAYGVAVLSRRLTTTT